MRKKLKFALEVIIMSSDEMEENKDESEFIKGAAFAYRCALGALKDYGGIDIDKIREGMTKYETN